MGYRKAILEEIKSIQALDSLESDHIKDAQLWVNSGAELCRIKKPAIPNKHLVSYFVVADGEYILLVDHKKAELWLPSGGHVAPNESPRKTVVREAYEELKIEADFILEHPLFLTVTETVGNVEKHTDVSLWYVLSLGRNTKIDFDKDEFHSIRWFNINDLPYERSDPHLKRFIEKYSRLI